MTTPSVPIDLSSKQVARFWSHVDQGGDCWPWMLATRRGGYGRTRVRGRNTALAHRVAWVLTRGPIPDGLLVCHNCDNPPCCNPSHLFLGTHLDNQRDKWQKGRGPTPEQQAAVRHPRGDEHPRRRHPERWPARTHSKLTEADVRTIRAEYAAGGITQQKLANRYGVRQTLISQVVLRQAWGSLI